jgi:hypothetical protein
LREVADVRAQYEKLRDDHGFKLADYNVDSDSASPRVCFQFTEDLAKRTDFTPFVTLAGTDKPALTTEDHQLCVDGLKHGERYNINLRAGLPSTVKEGLPKSAEFNIYVRDRKPFVRFTGRAYVLPRTGQQGIPVVSVNTPAVTVNVFRIGDRNLINTVIGSDFQQSLTTYQLSTLGEERGVKVWNGELATATTLNQEVVTAFPVDQAIGELQPGVYVMTAVPKDPGSDDDYQLATQWFIVSDLGISAFSGNDGIHVFVNSLASTAAVANAEVRLVARNNEILSSKKTDESGHVLFETGLARGEGGLSPAMLTVTDKAVGDKSDYAFLSLKTNAFDLSDRGVAGREVPEGADAFVYAERGVYRSNETVYLTALLRDGQGNAMTGTPLTMVVERPDGVEFRRAVLADQGAGGRSLTLPLNSAVPSGTWRVRVFTDPKGQAVGETTFLVEDYVPERLEFDVTSKDKVVKAEAPVELKVDGHFLYGAPASNLQLEGDMLVAPADSRPGFAGYQFGVDDTQTASNERTPIENLPETDDKGAATFPVNLASPPTSTRPQEARIFVRMAEAGGRAVERKFVLPVAPATDLIGVKPAFADKSVAEGNKADFDVVYVAPDGTTLARSNLRYELLKLESHYQWYRQDSSWNFEPVKTTKRIADGDLAIAANTPSHLSFSPPPGRYRLDVKSTDANGPITSVQFDVGWYSDGSADTPDLLETSIDKPQYSSGDTMVVSVNARTAGKLTVNVLGDRLLTTQSLDVKEGTSQVKIPVGRDWGTGAYVMTTLHRPLDVAAKRMPGRAIGLKWFGIDKQTRTLQVNLTPPALVRPNSSLKIPVKIGGLNPGEDAKVVIAAVDVGILNLTNYKPPAPDDYYLGQRQLTAEIRDLYGQLIDGMQGTRGQLRTGGDSGAELQGSPPTQKPLALYSGIVTVAADGTAEVNFDIPDFAGTARVMAVAWSATKLGRANVDVTVRDPVVLTATLPRFLLTGDHGTMSMDLDNVEGAAGDYVVNVAASGTVKVSGNPSTTLKLNAKQRSSMTLGLDAGGAGKAELDVSIKGPNGLSLARHYALDVKPATQVLARRSIRTLAKGESLTLTADMFSDLVPGTGTVSLSAGLSSALDAATILQALDRYPNGCSEQITSRAMPLLYVNELASGAHLAQDENVDQRIKDAIERLLARQGSNGSFGLWSAGGDDAWLDAYVTDFLTRAREKGFAVPDVLFKNALDRIRNSVVNANEPDKDGGRNLAYGLYVLARNGAAPVGDLRYLADTKLKDIATPIAKSQLAAALALVGDRNRAERVYASALDDLAPKPVLMFGRVDYGSALRDAAALVSLGAEGNAPRATITQAVMRVEAARGLTPYTSTQENAWMVLAARALAKETMALDLNGSTIKAALYRNYKSSELDGAPLKLTNTGDAPVQAVVSVSGSPVTPEPAASNGFKIERNYFTLDGKPVDISTAKQNDRFAVVLKITEPKPEYGHIMVSDYLPAGLEIDNPHLVSSGDTGTLSWIEDGQEAVDTQFRDDRFTAAIDRVANAKSVFTVAYVVRAVTPGKYVLPQAYVEDMYNPSRYGRTGTGSVEVRPAK